MEDMTLEEFFGWINERHRIAIKRLAGQGPPWTEDPWLQQFRFCNVFREMDKVTVWMRSNVREPLSKWPGPLVANVALARLFNWPPTLQTLRRYAQAGRAGGLVGVWNDTVRGRVETKLHRDMAQGIKVFTDAYLIRSVTDMPKVKFVLNIFGKIWAQRQELAESIKEHNTLQYAHERYKEFDYIGDFLAYEFVTDLRHTPLLGQATDIMTWASYGPGAERGLRRMGLHKNPLEGMQYLLAESPKYLEPHVPALEMRDIEHSLCEADKYKRVKHAEGPSRRYTYGG